LNFLNKILQTILIVVHFEMDERSQSSTIMKVNQLDEPLIFKYTTQLKF
jgi:hypothetical protein